MATNNNAKATDSAKKAMNSLPDEALYAIGVVASNVHKGVFWGFTDPKEVQNHYKALSTATNLRAIKVANAVIVEVNPSYLINSVKLVDPNLFKKEDINRMQQSMAEAVVEFQKWLLNNNIKHAGETRVVGIYSTNNVTTLSFKGNNFPAFRLNAEKAMHILAQCGYTVSIGGAFVPAQQAIGNDQLFGSMQLAPTKTGVFITIKPTYNSQQASALKKQMLGR